MSINDLKDLQFSNEAETMELLHPVTKEPMKTKDGKNMTIMVVSTDSERFRAADRKITNKKLRNNSRNKVLTSSVEEIEAELMERIKACIVELKDVVLDGKVLETNNENLNTLLEINWIREQIEAFVGDRANFIKA